MFAICAMATRVLHGFSPPRWHPMRRTLAGGFGILAALAVATITAGGAAAPHTGSKTAEKAKPAKGKPNKSPKTTAASAPTPAPPHPLQPVRLSISVRRATLANGLRVILNVDHASPTVAVAVTYDVGSRDEQPGKSGFAHLFEHMMFQGSRNVPKGDHFRLISSRGGQLNGTTSVDCTNYFEVLPSNELALALFLEADRMKALDISQENFENQRKVVEEEFRMRVSNAPYGSSFIRLEDLVYNGYFPYQHPTIGTMADLDGADLAWVKDFFAHHYAPNSAVLSIAGDMDPDAAIALVHQYFDGIPRTETTPFGAPPLPDQTAPRTATLEDSHVRTPGILYGWAVPPGTLLSSTRSTSRGSFSPAERAHAYINRSSAPTVCVDPCPPDLRSDAAPRCSMWISGLRRGLGFLRSRSSPSRKSKR